MSTPKTIRCAIYTRKSTEEGLEQEFNTLEAQREACEAYIKSQAHEGWRALPERFDDGGHSGGTLERPAMKRLLERVRDRRIDVILIYKIDRLTRSLTDFAKLAEQFDQYGVSFVSVTQQFNTTTSMGRLMLNVLLSFAQFEREIAGERIRDKIAASKKKGMWMGGSVPLGYDWKERKLVVNSSEAEIVRTLFDLYLKLGNVRSVVNEANIRVLRTKVRGAGTHRQLGGKAFSRGHVYAILNNPLYVGRVAHKGETYIGEQAAIISETTWQATQSRMAENRQGQRTNSAKGENANLLLGILFDADGNPFTPSYSVKNGHRYRYYIEQALVTGEQPAKGQLRRIPASEIENAVRYGVAQFFENPPELLKALGNKLDAATSQQAIKTGHIFGQQLHAGAISQWSTLLRPLLQSVALGPEMLDIKIRTGALRAIYGLPLPQQSARSASHYKLQIATKLRRRGGQRKLIVENEPSTTELDLALIKALAQPRQWFNELVLDQSLSLKRLARRERKASSYIGRVMRLAFCAPDIAEAITTGRPVGDMTAKRLILRVNLPLSWRAQRLIWIRS
jgi:DNA invertase Pin-like site-specific DNA recombinase